MEESPFWACIRRSPQTLVLPAFFEATPAVPLLAAASLPARPRRKKGSTTLRARVRPSPSGVASLLATGSIKRKRRHQLSVNPLHSGLDCLTSYGGNKANQGGSRPRQIKTPADQDLRQEENGYKEAIMRTTGFLSSPYLGPLHHLRLQFPLNRLRLIAGLRKSH